MAILYFFAVRKIWPGEELLIDYSYDPEDGAGKQEPCHCESPICRGTMYTNNERLLRYGAFCRQQVKGQKFKTQKAGTVLEPLAHYPKYIKDFSNLSLFANLNLKPIIINDQKIPSISALRRLLRSTGRILKFKNLSLSIWGIADEKILAQK